MSLGSSGKLVEVPACEGCGKPSPWMVNYHCAPCWDAFSPEERNEVRRAHGVIGQLEHWQETQPGDGQPGACGYCKHASITDGVCAFCGE